MSPISMALSHKDFDYEVDYDKVLFYISLADMSFQDVRTSLAIGYGDGLLNDEEFILLYDAFKSQNSVYPYWKFILIDFAWTT